MAYIAVINLNSPSGLIRAGKPVPRDYSRLEEAIRRGWVREDPNTPKIESAPDIVGETIEPILINESITETTEQPSLTASPVEGSEEEATDKSEPGPEDDELDAPELTLDSGVEELGFLMPMVIAGLEEIGISKIKDVAEKSVEDLMVVKGIGRATGLELLNAYQVIAGG